MTTVITCENGHYIALYEGVLKAGYAIKAEDFHTFADGMGDKFKPHKEISLCKCSRCDGDVFIIANGDTYIYTNDGPKP